ncbi:MAG TPA: TRAP transporter large permease subunit [Burkholderiales bacterium]|jgi:tripartite ATP-independent transporter DctM subunit|nr:TRAP transporter large permease subunit [Burkholderiales bacterium]
MQAQWLALSMLAVLAGALFSGLPVAVVLIGVGFLFAGAGILVGALRATDLGAIYFRVYGSLTDSDDILYATVPLLVFMGAMLQKTGAGEDLLLGIRGALRRLPGALPIAVILVGAALAPAAGVIAASVGALALLAFPVMLRQSYRPDQAAGVICAAGTLGVVVPPGIMLFFVADSIGVQIPALFLGMLGPLALLLAGYLAFAAFAVRTAAPTDSAPMQEQGPPVFSRLVLPIALLAAMLGSVAFGWATLSESAALGAAGAVAIAALQRRLTFRTLDEAIRDTLLTTAMVFFIFIGAQVFSLVFRLLGGGEMIVGAFRGLQLDSTGVLCTMLAVVFVLGFFFDWVEIVLITFPVLRAVLDGLDFGSHVAAAHLAPYWAAVLLALNLQTSFLTPPFGYALLLARGAAPPGVSLGQIYRGVLPYVLIQLLVIVAVVVFPSIATWLPSQAFDLAPTRIEKFKD